MNSFSSFIDDVACAKLNLALHVRRRRGDGYHDLETLFAFVADGDRLTVAPADAVRLSIGGPYGDALNAVGDDNLVMRAATALKTVFGIAAGAEIHLNKSLPIASGIGGGSADAATVLRLLCRLWAIDPADPRLMRIADQLGSDVPACLLDCPVIGTGRGEALSPIRPWPLAGLPVLLINPGVALATSDIFGRWAGRDLGALTMPPNAMRDAASMLAWLGGERNDLTAPAVSLAPVIADVLDWLAHQAGATLVRMSGSGATCFALFSDAGARDAAAAMVPGAWWHLASVLK